MPSRSLAVALALALPPALPGWLAVRRGKADRLPSIVESQLFLWPFIAVSALPHLSALPERWRESLLRAELVVFSLLYPLLRAADILRFFFGGSRLAG